MRSRLAALLAMVVAASAFASEPLHTFPASNIELYATGSVERVDVEGSFVQFHLADSAFFATALVFKDTLNDYPQLLAFSEQFINTAYPASSNPISSEIEVESEFANSLLIGREYLIDAESGTCELLLGHAVGDRTYMFFTITDPRGARRCVDAGADLRTVASQITASIAVHGN